MKSALSLLKSMFKHLLLTTSFSLSFDYSNSKLLDNLSDFNNGVVMVKIVNDILKSELTVEDFLKSYVSE